MAQTATANVQSKARRGPYRGVAGFVSDAKAAEVLGSTRAYIPELADAGVIRSVSVLGRRLYHEADVRATRERIERGESVG